MAKSLMVRWKSEVQTFDRRDGNPIKEIKNRHLGQTVLVVAPGPSLDSIRIDDLGKFITIGVNSVVELFQPTYWLFNDHQFVRHYNWIYSANGFTSSIVTHERRLKTIAQLVPPNVPMYWYRQHTEDIHLRQYPYEGSTPWWSRIENLLPGHCTVVATGLSLAQYLGASTVVLVGVDFKYVGDRHYSMGVIGATRKNSDYHRAALESGRRWMYNAFRRKLWHPLRVVTTSPILRMPGVEYAVRLEEIEQAARA